MEKEEKIVVVLLLMTTLSLAVAYVTIFPNTINQKIYKPLSQETDIGEVATVEGTVYDKSMTRTGDHLVLTIDYNAWLITVFVPANSGAEEINNMVVEGDVLRITGELEEYKGERELIVENKDDVVVLQPS